MHFVEGFRYTLRSFNWWRQYLMQSKVGILRSKRGSLISKTNMETKLEEMINPV